MPQVHIGDKVRSREFYCC